MHYGSKLTVSFAILAALSLPASSWADGDAVIASSDRFKDMVLPEGITSFNNHLYIGTYNVVNPTSSRILVFDTAGHLLNEIGGNPGEKLVGSGALLGLTIDKRNGDLYVGANFNSQIIRIQNPDSHPRVSLYAQLPSGSGPEDLNFAPDGRLYVSDSNLGYVWSIPSGGGKADLEIGPPGSGAFHSDNGLFASPVSGLSPNGIVFSLDNHRLFVANTYQDSIVVFDVNDRGHIASDGRLFAKFTNNDLEIYPSGFDPLVLPNTHLGFSASTPVNGPDGLALDADGNLWVASIFGDNLTVLDSNDGHIIRTLGGSAETGHGLLNMPAGITFIGPNVYNTNLGLFADGTHNNPTLPFTVTRQPAFTLGLGGNGNH